MLYASPPEDFRVVFEAVLCVVVCRSDVLLLLRKPGTTFGGLWGLPGGSIRDYESPYFAMIRELYEETKYRLGGRNSGSLRYAGKVWAEREPLPEESEDLPYRPGGIFYVYGLKVPEKSSVVVVINDEDEEHEDSVWVNLEDIPVIKDKTVPDLAGFIRIVYPDV